MATDAGKFVGLLFLARDVAHRAHLKTRSFSQHSALGEFYNEVIDLADSFAEACQGRYNELLDIPLLDNDYEGEIASVLKQQLDWIQKNREKVCSRKETALQNIIDEVEALYYSTLYKLNFLE